MSDVGNLIYLPRRLRMVILLLLATILAGAVWPIWDAIFGMANDGVPAFAIALAQTAASGTALAVVLLQSRRDMAFGSLRHVGHEAKLRFSAQDCPDGNSHAVLSFSTHEPGHDFLQDSAARFCWAQDIAQMTRAVAQSAIRNSLSATGARS